MDSIRKRHLQMPEILFISAACFAMAAIGFFGAVFFQLRSPHVSENMASGTVTTEVDRTRAVAALSGKLDSTSAAGISSSSVTVSQADIHDANANAKLDVLNSLSAH